MTVMTVTYAGWLNSTPQERLCGNHSVESLYWAEGAETLGRFLLNPYVALSRQECSVAEQTPGHKVILCCSAIWK